MSTPHDAAPDAPPPGGAPSRWPVVSRVVLAAMMVAVGVMHFVDPQPFVRIVPAALPAPLALVYVSGFFEVAGGLGLLHPSTRRAAALGLVALYVAVFPANVNMAVNHIQPTDAHVPAAMAWARLPFQLVFIAWAWSIARAAGSSRAPR